LIQKLGDLIPKWGEVVPDFDSRLGGIEATGREYILPSIDSAARRLIISTQLHPIYTHCIHSVVYNDANIPGPPA